MKREFTQEQKDAFKEKALQAKKDLKALEEGLALIEQTEAYQNYGIPSGIPFKNLIGNVIPIFRK